MCGIIYVKRKDGHNANRVVIKQYKKQKSRGSQGFGILGIRADKLETFHCETEKAMMQYLEKNEFTEILFHHRTPTSTKNHYKAAHPILIKNRKNLKSNYYFTHNGIIYNTKKLKEKHEAMGFKYTTELDDGTFNDSESLGIEFALWLEGKQEKIEAEGVAAIIAIEVEPKTNRCLKLHFAKETNPLNLYSDANLTIISSEGSGQPIEADKLFSTDYKTKKTAEKEIKLTENFKNTVYNGYHRNYRDNYDYEDEDKKIPLENLSDKNDLIIIIQSSCRAACDAIAKNDWNEAMIALNEIEDISEEISIMDYNKKYGTDYTEEIGAL